MLSKTRGIVLHRTKYSDSSTIVTIYTELYGRSSFIVRGLNNKKSATKSALFQPLTLVDIDMHHYPGKEIHSIKDIRIAVPLTNIYSSPIKNSIALFIAELIFKTIKITTPDEQLFQFLFKSVEVFDFSIDKPENFHLIYMYKLSRFLGFEPNCIDKHNLYFDLIAGEYTNLKPLHAQYLTGKTSQNFSMLAELDYFNMNLLALNRGERNELLNALIEYYRLHVTGFHSLNSTEVLHRIFD